MTAPVELSLCFGPENRLVGTLCLPSPDGVAAAAPSAGLLLFNAGLLPRVGAHRLNVKLARRLAAQGVPSLRFDLSGLGDSQRSSQAQSFEAQSLDDLRAAMDCLAAEAGVQQFGLLGFCSGGRVGYHAAPLEPRIRGLVLYDTYAFSTWRSRWRRLRLRLARQGPWGVVQGAVLRRLRRTAAQAATEGVAAGHPTALTFEQQMAGLAAQGVKLAVVHSGEGDNYNYADQFADRFGASGLAARVELAYLPALDHNLASCVPEARTYTVALYTRVM